jgi:hypothetical protein
MFERLEDFWSELKRGRPGSRFQEQYEERREEGRGIGRLLRIIAGFILIPVGIFFLAVPGPGLVVIAIGAVMIAREFRFAAQVLDAFEVRARNLFDWAQRRWHRLVKARRATGR